MSVTTACIRCNAPLDPGARFCQVCGLSISGEQTAPLPTLLQVLRQATLGEYEILREIGQGGMATVYLAHEIALDRKVAIKVMSPQFVHGAEMIERFKREARTSAGLNHPHIIPIYSVRESGSLLFFVMKYINGRSLDAILRETGPLSFPMVRSILADVGAALDYAHRQSVIHRDVKPGNIMLDEEGFAVITDFGIARAAEADALTRSGTTVGTPSYLSPEACSGDLVGPAADQYSLGIVGYEMITGQLPFSADSSLGMMYAQVHASPRPSEPLRPDCPPDLREAVMRMLAKSPADRFPTLRDAVLAVGGGRASGSFPDDDVRSHIGILATAPSNRPSAEAGRTPSSPAAMPRMAQTPRGRRRRRIRLTRILVGLFLAGLGASAAYVTLRARAEGMAATEEQPTADSSGARTDSMLAAAQGAAQYARLRAVATGAEPLALAPGDSVMAIAESLMAEGRKLEAGLLIARATSLWGAAEIPGGTIADSLATPEGNTTQTPPGSAAFVPPLTPAPVAPGRTETYAPPTVPDSVKVVQFYADLERAIEARQLGEVRRLLPNLNENEERFWRGLFEDRNTKSIEATYQVLSLTSVSPVQIFARVHLEIEAIRKGNKVETKRQGDEFAELTLGPQGWRQIRSEKVKQ